jgi:hypothetical protein
MKGTSEGAKAWPCVEAIAVVRPAWLIHAPAPAATRRVEPEGHPCRLALEPCRPCRRVGCRRPAQRYRRFVVGYAPHQLSPGIDRLRPVFTSQLQSGVDRGTQGSVKPLELSRRKRHVLVLEKPVEGAGRRAADNRLMERRRKPINVRPRTLIAAGKLLGCRIAGREDGRCCRRVPCTHSACRTKVDQCRSADCVHQDVRRLDVAMKKSSRVNLLQPFEQRPSKVWISLAGRQARCDSTS